MEQTGHQRLLVVRRSIRRVSLFAGNAAAKVGP
jgi:hypothetical protein